jgi:hypothetical protein
VVVVVEHTPRKREEMAVVVGAVEHQTLLVALAYLGKALRVVRH